MQRSERSNHWLALTAVVLLGALLSDAMISTADAHDSQGGDAGQRDDRVSPARRINHDPERRGQDRSPPPSPPANGDDVYRTIDGSYNNESAVEMGAAHTDLYRLMDADYSDGVSALAGAERLSARVISNSVATQYESMPNPLQASDYLWQWGQFLDHDINLTDGVHPAEPADIPVPSGDQYFDPGFTGTQVILFNRSIYDPATNGPRQQINEITAWIDASNVYGSNQARADALRTLAGDGKLKTSDGDLLPFNDEGLPNAGGDSRSLFLAGDVRANEQVGLAVMHTLFVREHNRLADLIAERNPGMTGEEIYQKARQLVGAEMQIITYREYLPALLGPGSLRPYKGYQDDIDGSITNSFSAAAYRYGHSALSETLLRLDEFGREIIYGHLSLRDAFFNPSSITDEGGIEPVLRGLASQVCQTVDARVIDDVRNFLFGAPGSGGFDLVSLNIQRGRDHGLPSYNDARKAMGLSYAIDFSDMTRDFETQARLSEVYTSPDEVDLWVGGLSEDPVPKAHVGPLFHAMISEQFEALRDGDRYWYTLKLTREERDMVEWLRLSDIIRLNTSIDGEIQDDVFRVRPNQNNGERRRRRPRG